jgi:hypothetical protein
VPTQNQGLFKEVSWINIQNTLFKNRDVVSDIWNSLTMVEKPKKGTLCFSLLLFLIIIFLKMKVIHSF